MGLIARVSSRTYRFKKMSEKSKTGTKTKANSGESNQIIDPRQSLKDAINKKLQIEKELAKIERQIFDFEGTYLEDTAVYVVKGWEKYLTLKTNSTDLSKLKKFDENDRLFSQSSATSNLVVGPNPVGYADHLKDLLKNKRSLTREKSETLVKRSKKSSKK